MKAMMLAQPAPVDEAPLALFDRPRPEPGPGQVRLRVSVCGVCHTDLHTVEGELSLPLLPIIPGHQVVGFVEALGQGASRFELGDRVGVAWLNWACGECDQCLRGLENLCPNARYTGLDVHGGYAEALVVDERFAFHLPEAFSDLDAAPLLCAGIVGYRALRLSEAPRGGRLGLYGFGASAHLVIQVARHWGCEIAVFTRSEAHRELARELGAGFVGGAEDAIDEPLDAGIIFAPAGWIVPLALQHLRPGGTLAINAIHMSPIPEMPYRHLYMERTLRSVANFTRNDATSFLKTAEEIGIRSDVVAFPLDEANNVLRRVKHSDLRAAAALRIA